VIERLLEIQGLKALLRTGWVREGVPDPESVAAHSWGVAWLTLALLPAHLDLARALTYAVLHDLPEVRAGDVTPHDPLSRAEKAAAERDAMAGLSAELPRGAALRASWEAYEAQADPEARFVRQLDRLDMALQAIWYTEAHGLPLGEFLDSAHGAITDPDLIALITDLRRRALDATR